MTHTPDIDDALLPGMDRDRLFGRVPSAHPPRILMLYGSLRTGLLRKSGDRRTFPFLGQTDPTA